MNKLGRILIADNEDIFRQSTADLLRRENYHCESAHDATEATEKLKTSRYDLLISDIKMPGNTALEFIVNVSSIAAGLPVILITGYPSLSSAIQSVNLPVQAYLVKPVEFDELLSYINISIQSAEVYHSVRKLDQQLQKCSNELSNIEELLKSSHDSFLAVPTDSFVELTFQNITESLADIKHLTKYFATGQRQDNSCHLLNCPRLESMTQTVLETIDTLKKTKSAFKSRELGEIRRKLETLVYNKAE